MKVFLAGLSAVAGREQFIKVIKETHPFLLESYAYINEHEIKLLADYGDFMLDSGAFTFRQNTKTEMDWKDFVRKYAKFVVEYDIKKFFELDIDPLIGYDAVKEIRQELDKLTGRPCIPVWHLNRGLKDFEETTKQYPYVALGGIAGATKGSAAGKKYESSFSTLIKIAHRNGAKIHGLGYTSMANLKKYHFDSVDSTAWLVGNRVGFMYHFDNKGMLHRIDRPPGFKINKEKVMDLRVHNFHEWIKFQKWVEKNW